MCGSDTHKIQNMGYLCEKKVNVDGVLLLPYDILFI